MPDLAGHLCCVYKFGVEDADTEESVEVADSVEASVPPSSLSPPLRLKLVPLRVSESLSISRLMVWSTMRAYICVVESFVWPSILLIVSIDTPLA